jgi:hypothetical protein
MAAIGQSGKTRSGGQLADYDIIAQFCKMDRHSQRRRGCSPSARAYEQGFLSPDRFITPICSRSQFFCSFSAYSLRVHIDNIVQRQPNISSHEISFTGEETVRFIESFGISIGLPALSSVTDGIAGDLP